MDKTGFFVEIMLKTWIVVVYLSRVVDWICVIFGFMDLNLEKN